MDVGDKKQAMRIPPHRGVPGARYALGGRVRFSLSFSLPKPNMAPVILSFRAARLNPPFSFSCDTGVEGLELLVVEAPFSCEGGTALAGTLGTLGAPILVVGRCP